MKRFGLIGFPVAHSYSQRFFSEKFQRLGLSDHVYELFEMEFLSEFPALWLRHNDLVGLNVTVPHKEKVLRYLNKLDASAIKVGAANVIFRKGKDLIGYNTDYMAFRESLANWIGEFKGEALILGSGGASKAVQAALEDLKIPHSQLSRSAKSGDYTYDQLIANPEILTRYGLIVNTTPLGMHPNEGTLPDLPYDFLRGESYLYDLVYNPDKTAFMKIGEAHGAQTKNGLEMLELQAERSWDIWNQ